MVGRIMPHLKGVHILIPYVLQGKVICACVIKLRILRCRDYLELSQWDSNVIERVLIRELERQRHQEI